MALTPSGRWPSELQNLEGLVSSQSEKDRFLQAAILRRKQPHLPPCHQIVSASSGTVRVSGSFVLIFQNKHGGLLFRCFFPLIFKELYISGRF